MVAMFSFFCEAAEPIFNNCFSSTNGGYDYLMFPNENRRKHGFSFVEILISKNIFFLLQQVCIVKLVLLINVLL